MLTKILLTIFILVGIIEIYGWVERYPTITIVNKYNRNVFLTVDHARNTDDMNDKNIAKWNVLDIRRFLVLWKMGKDNWAFRKISYPKVRMSNGVNNK